MWYNKSPRNGSKFSSPSHRFVGTKLPTQFHIDRLYDSTRLTSQNTTLTRLRTGTFNLNYYLHKINRADNPNCQCGFNNETIAHFLLYCPMYRAQRRILHNNVTKIAGRSASPLNLDVLLDQPKCTPSNLIRSSSHNWFNYPTTPFLWLFSFPYLRWVWHLPLKSAIDPLRQRANRNPPSSTNIIIITKSSVHMDTLLFLFRWWWCLDSTSRRLSIWISPFHFFSRGCNQIYIIYCTLHTGQPRWSSRYSGIS